MKKRAMILLALAAAMGMTFGTAAFAEEAKTETKTITVDGEELTVEVTDIGKQGTFTYWSAVYRRFTDLGSVACRCI